MFFDWYCIKEFLFAEYRGTNTLFVVCWGVAEMFLWMEGKKIAFFCLIGFEMQGVCNGFA
jgi:hypothetical protein